MKKIIAVLCLGMLCSSVCLPACAQEQPSALAYYAKTPITIDGNVSEWNLSSPLEVKEASCIIRDADTWLGEEDLSAIVYLMWDEEHLFLAADVQDASPFGAVGILPHDMEDNFKLYLSTNPDSDPQRSAYDTNDFLLYLMMDNQNWYTAFDRSMIDRSLLARFTSRGMDENTDVLSGYEQAYTITDRGFLFEASIPWSNFSNDHIESYCPASGDTVNFDFCITDNDYPFPNTESSVQMSWCGTAEINQNPGLWGRLTFEGE